MTGTTEKARLTPCTTQGLCFIDVLLEEKQNVMITGLSLYFRIIAQRYEVCP